MIWLIMLKELYAEAEQIKQIANDVRRGRAIEAWFEKACNIETNECKIWPFALMKGYGTLQKKLKVSVHVAAAVKAKGPVPLGYQTAHGPCHNRACFNYKHLEYKTSKENAADRLRDGTDLRGEKHSSSKLSNKQVEEILDMFHKGVSYRKIAQLYGISHTVVYSIRTGRRITF